MGLLSLAEGAGAQENEEAPGMESGRLDGRTRNASMGSFLFLNCLDECCRWSKCGSGVGRTRLFSMLL